MHRTLKRKRVVFGILFSIVGGCVLIFVIRPTPKKVPVEQRVLTEQYGKEVSEIIYDADMKMWAAGIDAEPDVYKEFLTGEYLELYLEMASHDHSQNTDSPVIELFAYEIHGIRVYEYSPQGFRAIACSLSGRNQFTPEGEFVKEWVSYDVHNLYIFSWEDDTWKMALRFNLDNAYRDWVYAQPWEMELVGDLDTYLYADCLSIPDN